jgi:hypothetical protein
MRETHRTRREISHGALVLLKPFFRYSMSRNAYVLRAVGSRVGPVLVEAGHHPPPEH